MIAESSTSQFYMILTDKRIIYMTYFCIPHNMFQILQQMIKHKCGVNNVEVTSQLPYLLYTCICIKHGNYWALLGKKGKQG
jgi:hypothetical protein